MRRFSLLLALLLPLAPLPALADTTERMKPKAPIKNFRLPRFGDNGYTQWVLRGAEGIYQSAEQIDVKDMALRIYSGDERLAVELSLDSPQAAILVKENRAVSDAPIKIVGANFTISGTGWSWDGATRAIVVNSGSKVEFSQSLGDSLVDVGQGLSIGGEQTTIYSERLELKTTADGYFFEFEKDVRVESGDMELTSQLLTAVADAPEGRDEASRPEMPSADTKLESVRQVVAREDVVIRQVDRVIYAGKADFDPRAKSALLTGLPRVEMPGAFISGESIFTQQGEVIVTGGEGRAQMILTETGGLGIQGASTLSEETIVLSNKILMEETESNNRFVFEGRVDVMSGAITQRSDTLTVLARSQPSGDADEGALKVGEVYELVAKGGVVIEQNSQRVSADEVTYHPLEESAVLLGDPQVADGESVIQGQRIDLKPGRVIVTGTEEERVVVVLPEMPDMGYESSITASIEQNEPASTPETETEPKETIVKSRVVEMIENPKKTLFRFIDSVEVKATNLEATCRQMDVSAAPTGLKSDSGRDLKVERVVARDNVVILQENRISTCDTADILPEEGKVILNGNASVDDAQGKVSGHRITLNQGQRRAMVEGTGSEDGRARITIPGFDGGSF